MTGDSDNGFIRYQFAGCCFTPYASALIILDTEFKFKTLKLSRVDYGDAGTLGYIDTECSIIATHRRAHTNLDGLTWSYDGAAVGVAGTDIRYNVG